MIGVGTLFLLLFGVFLRYFSGIQTDVAVPVVTRKRLHNSLCVHACVCVLNACDNA